MATDPLRSEAWQSLGYWTGIVDRLRPAGERDDAAFLRGIAGERPDATALAAAYVEIERLRAWLRWSGENNPYYGIELDTRRALSDEAPPCPTEGVGPGRS